MIDIVLSHDSSLAHWRHPKTHAPVSYMSKESIMEAIDSTPSAFSAQDRDVFIEKFKLDYLPFPLHVLVSSSAKRRKLEGMVFHCESSELPAHSLVSISDHQIARKGALYSLMCVSPELCFMQMATRVGFLELLELGYELCGRYKGITGEQSESDLVTKVDKIKVFLEKAHQAHGVKQARRAAKYIVDNSWSHKETQITILIVLPRATGGFGIKQPLLNQEIKVSGEVRRVLKGDKLIPDLYWPEIGTVIEYDSDEFHGTKEEQEHDARKRSAYRLIGIDVITINYDQLRDFDTFSVLMEDLARRFGRRFRPASPEQRCKQRETHRWLLYGERQTK